MANTRYKLHKVKKKLENNFFVIIVYCSVVIVYKYKLLYVIYRHQNVGHGKPKVICYNNNIPLNRHCSREVIWVMEYQY